MVEQRTGLQKLSTAIASMLMSSTGGLENFRFYGWMAAQLNRRVDNSIETMALAYDYNAMQPEVLINEEFVQKATMAELRAILCHEVIHLANRHPNRRSSRDPYRFNIAADMAVNNVINRETQYVAQSSIRLPANCIKPIPNMNETTAEAFYDYVKAKNKKGGKGQKWVYKYNGTKGNVRGDVNATGSHDQWASFDDLPSEQFDAQVLSMVKQATIAAGSSPGHINDAIAGLLKPKISWKHALRSFVGNNTKIATVGTWSRPSRRIRPIIDPETGEIRPVAQGRRYIRSGTLGIVIDTSGSVPNEELQQFMTEINTISVSHAIWVCECDAEVGDVYKYNARDYIANGRKFTGRGGTDMNPGIETLNRHKDVEMVIILTDGYLFRSPHKQQKPELWIITPNGSTSYVQDRRHIVMQD